MYNHIRKGLSNYLSIKKKFQKLEKSRPPRPTLSNWESKDLNKENDEGLQKSVDSFLDAAKKRQIDVQDYVTAQKSIRNPLQNDIIPLCNDNWISVKDSFPDPLETVFISNGKGWTSIGCRTDLLDDGEGGYTWCWAEANGTIYQEEGKLVAECECEDLDVLYWHKLPLPKY